MASWKKAFPGSYLKKEDLTGDFTATIKSWRVEEVGSEDDKDKKLVLHFHETPPGCEVSAMVCNKTNCGIIEEVLGTDDIDQWIGKRITLFNNPKITFGGKKVGGISVREKSAEVQVDPFAPVVAIPRKEFTAEELTAMGPHHYAFAIIYNDIVRTSPAAAAALPGNLFVVGDTRMNWETVLNLKSEKGLAWINGKLIPAAQQILSTVVGGPGVMLSDDDIPF